MKSESKTFVVLGRAFRLGRYVRNSNFDLIFSSVTCVERNYCQQL